MKSRNWCASPIRENFVPPKYSAIRTTLTLMQKFGAGEGVLIIHDGRIDVLYGMCVHSCTPYEYTEYIVSMVPLRKITIVYVW